MRIMRCAPTFDLAQAIADRDVLLVRNKYDDWLTPDFTNLKKSNPQLETIELPGDHDDITHNPERYVELIESLANQENQEPSSAWK